MAKHCNCLFLAIVRFEDSRPLRPRIIRCTFYRRLRHHFKLCNRFCSKADTCSNTVITGIATTDHKYMFIFCKFIWRFFKIGIQKCLGNFSKKIYSKVNTFCFSSPNFDVSRIRCSTCKDHAVIFLKKFFCSDIFSDIGIQNKLHTFFFHQMNSSVYDRFFQFHIRNTVTEKSARSVTSFINCNTVSSSVQLLCRCQTGWTTSDYCDRLSCTNAWNLWFYPSFLPRSFNDCSFIFFCRYRLTVQITGTCRLTKSRTHSGSKLRKTMCLGKS